MILGMLRFFSRIKIRPHHSCPGYTNHRGQSPLGKRLYILYKRSLLLVKQIRLK